jgi:transcriptional regulator with XRE-family HTH domain
MVQVGRSAGISFQQVHKYEIGLCAVSASRLWSLSQVLDVEVSYFYGGLPYGAEVTSPCGRSEPVGATRARHPEGKRVDW